MLMILAKALILASLVFVGAFVSVPLGLLAAANGLPSFQVGAYSFLGLLPIGLGTAFAFLTVLLIPL